VSTAQLFDELFARYDSWFERNRVTAENEVKLVEYMVKGAPRPILEVGIGTGYFASRLGVEAGLDPSFNMLSIARSRGVELLVKAVGENMPFREGAFGTVLIIVTLCFVDDPIAVLRESHRVLRDGGTLIACVIPKDSSWGEHYEELGRKGHPFYSKARFYTLREVVEMLETAGFKIEGAVGTLSYTPGEEPRYEEPSSHIEGRGFICLKAAKQPKGPLKSGCKTSSQ